MSHLFLWDASAFGVIFLWILGLAVLIGIAYLLRNAICWYYKINDIVKSLENIQKSQEATAHHLERIVNIMQKP